MVRVQTALEHGRRVSEIACEMGEGECASARRWWWWCELRAARRTCAAAAGCCCWRRRWRCCCARRADPSPEGTRQADGHRRQASFAASAASTPTTQPFEDCERREYRQPTLRPRTRTRSPLPPTTPALCCCSLRTLSRAHALPCVSGGPSSPAVVPPCGPSALCPRCPRCPPSPSSGPAR